MPTLTSSKLANVEWVVMKTKIAISGNVTTIYKALAPIGSVELSNVWMVKRTIIDTSAVAASSVVTLASPAVGNKVTINSVDFTAVASGATGNQWVVGTSDTVSATNLAAAINASVSVGVANVVTAESKKGRVSIIADTAGTAGNSITLTKTGTPISLIPNTGTLLGGAAANSGVTSIKTAWANGNDQDVNTAINFEGLSYS
jgi:hypothetical protein